MWWLANFQLHAGAAVFPTCRLALFPFLPRTFPGGGTNSLVLTNRCYAQLVSKLMKAVSWLNLHHLPRNSPQNCSFPPVWFPLRQHRLDPLWQLSEVLGVGLMQTAEHEGPKIEQNKACKCKRAYINFNAMPCLCVVNCLQMISHCDRELYEISFWAAWY